MNNSNPENMNTHNSEAHEFNQQGEKLAAENRFQDAMDLFQKAAAARPDWVVPINNMGVVFWQAGDKKAAIEWMGKAYRMDPDHRETVQNLTEMLAHVDHLDSAFLVMQSYLRRHPDDSDMSGIAKDLRPPIRILHHMARSGGTIISKCLGCMNRVLLLSEVHPLGMQWFDPLIQACEWFNLISKEELNELKMADLSFLHKIIQIYERVVGQNRQLVLRDWTHLDFTGVPFVKNPSYALTTASVLQDRFQIIHFATVRHPIDQWLSLSRLAVMQGHITVAEFMEGYRRFAECAREIGFIRYEDFTRDPQSGIQSICAALELEYDETFINKWSTYRTITGDTKSERGSGGFIKPMPRRAVDTNLLKQFEACRNYWDSLDILGYS